MSDGRRKEDDDENYKSHSKNKVIDPSALIIFFYKVLSWIVLT